MNKGFALLFLRTGTLSPASLQSAEAGDGVSASATRESITILLGEDEDPANLVFFVAERFFLQESAERTDHLVRDLRPLQGVRDYLEDHPAQRGGTWGLVNLVVHGNEHGLMDVDVLPNSPKATFDTLAACYLCESRDLFFRPGERPSNGQLASQFRSKHPKLNIDPIEALTHPFSSSEGEAFGYEAPVIYCWTLVFPGNRQAPP